MGWTGIPGGTRELVIQEQTAGWEYEGKVTTCIKHEVFRENLSTGPGFVLYALMETSDVGAREVTRWALIVLIEEKPGQVLYKVMDSSVGPHYYNFPVGWLDELTAPVSDWDREWRGRIRHRALACSAN